MRFSECRVWTVATVMSLSQRSLEAITTPARSAHPGHIWARRSTGWSMSSLRWARMRPRPPCASIWRVRISRKMHVLPAPVAAVPSTARLPRSHRRITDPTASS